MNALWHDADPKTPWRAHGNGAIEGSDTHLKGAVSKGCCCVGGDDLSNVDAYRHLVGEVFGQANARLPNASPPSAPINPRRKEIRAPGAWKSLSGKGPDRMSGPLVSAHGLLCSVDSGGAILQCG
jgi:hypothetical protein